jgi:dihydrolipoamide dehydrogenase
MYNKEQPKSCIVVGSGAIGMEFGYFYKQFGTEVTVVEMMDRILPVEDEDVSKQMLRHYKKMGFNFELGHTLTAVDTKGKGVKAPSRR